MYQSNPLALGAIVLLATALLYEWRYDLRRLLEWLLIRAIHPIAFLFTFWWVPVLMGVCYTVDRWLGWRWLLTGIARICGAMVILFVLFLFWTELVQPFTQKLARRWTR